VEVVPALPPLLPAPPPFWLVPPAPLIVPVEPPVVSVPPCAAVAAPALPPVAPLIVPPDPPVNGEPKKSFLSLEHAAHSVRPANGKRALSLTRGILERTIGLKP